MEEVMMGVLTGIKLSIFLLVWIYSSLTYSLLQKKGLYWLNIVSIAFILMTIVEFITLFLRDFDFGPGLLLWTIQLGQSNVFNYTLFTIIGFGLIMFLQHLDKNLKEYR